jgi:hypothetical protein
MPRRPTSATSHARALRVLADELESGKRELSPAMAKALTRELGRPDDDKYEELSPAEWERAWSDEIELRLADYQAGKARKVDLGTVIDGLRSRAR